MGLITRAMLMAVLAIAGGGGEGTSIALYDLERQVHGPVESGDITCGTTAPLCPNAAGAATTVEYPTVVEPHLEADDFVTERAQALVADVTGQPAAILDVRPESAKSFETFTRTLAWVGREEGEPQHLAIVIDRELVAWPAIDYSEYPDGLSATGGIQIAVPRLEDAQRLAREIRGEED